MSDPASYSVFLAQLARAYGFPEERRELCRARPCDLSWETQENAIAEFLVATIAASAGDVRPQLHAMLIDLGWRPSLLGDRVLSALGIDERRKDLLAAIADAFPVAPLEGCVIREAYLRDEEAFRVVAPEEYEQARTVARTETWQGVPDDEINFAFSKNSVYVWLDVGAFTFYLPACLAYALREGGQCEFYTFLHFAEMPYEKALAHWTPAQCLAIAGFMAFAVADAPGRSVVADHRANIDTWLAANERR